MIRVILSFLILLILIQGTNSKDLKPPYKNANLPVEDRVNDLLSRMTIEEKFWQLFMIPWRPK